jgi:hypothetical protein
MASIVSHRYLLGNFHLNIWSGTVFSPTLIFDPPLKMTVKSSGLETKTGGLELCSMKRFPETILAPSHKSRRRPPSLLLLIQYMYLSFQARLYVLALDRIAAHYNTSPMAFSTSIVPYAPICLNEVGSLQRRMRRIAPLSLSRHSNHGHYRLSPQKEI